MEGSVYLKARQEWNERYAIWFSANVTGRSPPRARSFIITVNNGVKPPNYWALLLHTLLSTIDFNRWTCAALTTP
jgi:hypothetical protein